VFVGLASLPAKRQINPCPFFRLTAHVPRLTNQFSWLAGEPQLLAITMIPPSPPLPSSAVALRLSETWLAQAVPHQQSY
jgi:hypothetical protein